MEPRRCRGSDCIGEHSTTGNSFFLFSTFLHLHSTTLSRYIYCVTTLRTNQCALRRTYYYSCLTMRHSILAPVWTKGPPSEESIHTSTPSIIPALLDWSHSYFVHSGSPPSTTPSGTKTSSSVTGSKTPNIQFVDSVIGSTK